MTNYTPGSPGDEFPRGGCSDASGTGTESTTNRHGDDIRIGQLWTDDPRRSTVRTLRIDELVAAGSLGTRAVCTVIRSHDTETGQVTEPGRIVSIKVDSLHTTPSGRGYRIAGDTAPPQL